MRGRFGKRPSSVSNHRVEGFQGGILFREIPEGAVHLEADLQVGLGVADITEKSFVTTHVVIINRLFEQRDRTADQEILGFSGLAELVETKAGMEKSRAGIGGGAAKFLAHAKGQGPLFLSHQMMKPQMEDLRTILKTPFNCIEFGERL